MKHRLTVITALAALVLSSCTPVVYNMEVQVRKASASGVDLVGKSISLVTVQSEDLSDTLFTKTVAETLATTLEDEFFSSKQAVALYEMPGVEGAKYGRRDSLVHLLMQTGTDVIILQDRPKLVLGENGDRLFQADVYVYDSMDKADKVRMFHYSDVLSEDTKNVASRFAGNVAARIVPTWETAFLPLYFFEDSGEWIESLDLCEKGKWNKAIEKWMPKTSTGSAISRACASYNIAAACYALGDAKLAQQWLDASAELAELEAAPKLRRKINNMISNQNK